MTKPPDYLEAFGHHLTRHIELAAPGLAVGLGMVWIQALAFKDWVSVHPIPLVLVALLLVDFSTGTYKAVKVTGWDSAVGKAGGVKIVISLIALACILMVANAYPILGLALQFLLGVPIVTELGSIFENLSDIEDHYGPRANTRWIKWGLRLVNSAKLNLQKQAEAAIENIAPVASPAPQEGALNHEQVNE